MLQKFHENTVNGNWTDIEVLYYDTLVSLVKKYSGHVKMETLIREYNKKFDKMKSKFLEYLSNVKPPWVEGENQEKYLKKIHHYTSNFFNEIFESNNDDIQVDDVMVLNFNYTNTFNDLNPYFPLNYTYKLNHIHGNIRDKNNVIFGFGDELDKDYTLLESERSGELFKHIKHLHYLQSKNYDRLNEFISDNKYEVFIVGHSCGISDRTILNEIFENENCESIRIFYHERKDLSNNKTELHTGIMKHFVKNKTRMRKKIKTFTDDDKMSQLMM